MSEAEVTKSLANKLAAANLTNDEANMLIALIHAERDEVEGFLDKSSPKVQGFNIGMPPTIETDNASKWIDVLNIDWGSNKPGGGSA